MAKSAAQRMADLRSRRACGQAAVTLDLDKRVGGWRNGLTGQSLPASSGVVFDPGSSLASSPACAGVVERLPAMRTRNSIDVRFMETVPFRDRLAQVLVGIANRATSLAEPRTTAAMPMPAMAGLPAAKLHTAPIVPRQIVTIERVRAVDRCLPCWVLSANG